MTDKEYREHKNISQSDLKLFLEHPKVFEHYKILNNKRPEDAALAFGRLIHTRVLEEHLFEKMYAIMPKINGKTPRRNSKACIEFLEANKGKEICPSDQFKVTSTMIQRLKQNRIAYAYLYRAKTKPADDPSIQIFNELPIIWECSETGMKLKSKLDRVIIDHEYKIKTIVDYKTTSESNAEDFRKSVKKYGYAGQAAFYDRAFNYYMDNVLKINSSEYKSESVLIGQSKTPPFQIICTEISEEKKEIEWNILKQGLERMKECFETKYWESCEEEMHVY